MKKFAIILISIIFALHFPVTSQNLIPNGWVQDFQDGKKVAQLFISFYRSQTAAAKPKVNSPKVEVVYPPQPLVYRQVIFVADLRPANQATEECKIILQKVGWHATQQIVKVKKLA